MRRLPWPLPALLVWAAAWLAYLLLLMVSGHWLSNAAVAVTAVTVATLLGAAGALLGSTPWRRIFIGLGFPLSLAASGAAAVPAWAWLLPAGLCLLVYPPRAWRDAPVFPTPRGALAQLADAVPLPPGASVLDAGCGLGDGLLALRAAYPHASLHGLEWSWPLAALAALRCRAHGNRASVRQGDIWRADWRHHALVYLFQRPESMPRAAAKALAEMPPGSWLVSLEFPVRDWLPSAVLAAPDGRPVWCYQRPGSVKNKVESDAGAQPGCASSY